MHTDTTDLSEVGYAADLVTIVCWDIVWHVVINTVILRIFARSEGHI